MHALSVSEPCVGARFDYAGVALVVQQWWQELSERIQRFERCQRETTRFTARYASVSRLTCSIIGRDTREFRMWVSEMLASHPEIDYTALPCGSVTIGLKGVST